MSANASSTRKKITVVTPVFNEEGSLPLYEQAVRESLFASPEYDFEVLLVDDGSADRSWEVIREMAARDGRFRGLRLSRNFGSHVALSAGFAHATGAAAATLPCDLQDPPGTILEFLARWRAGAKIVWGHRRTRNDGLLRAAVSRVFFHLIRRFAMPRGSRFATGSFFLADRQVVECYRQFREHNRITFALMAWTGFQQDIVRYDRRARQAGKSGWTFGRMFKAMYDAFVGFSFVPIRLMTVAGIAAFALTFVLVLYYLYCWMTSKVVPGYTSLMVSLTFFFGVQFLFMGIAGEYLYRIYAEAVRRPLFFISETTAPQRQGDHAG